MNLNMMNMNLNFMNMNFLKIPVKNYFMPFKVIQMKQVFQFVFIAFHLLIMYNIYLRVE